MAWLSCQTKLSYKYRKRTHTVTPSLEESYLRLDVSCASEACDVCRVGGGGAAITGTNGSVAGAPAAAAAPAATLSASAPYYLIPDAEALSELVEVLELPDISNYILLASAVKQVAVHAGRKASRLRALYRDRRRRAVLFDDLHCADTAAAGEMVPRTLSAALFYAHHLGGRVPLVVLSDKLAEAAAAAAGGDAGADGFPDPSAGPQQGPGAQGGEAADWEALQRQEQQRQLLHDYLAAAAAAGITVLSSAQYFSSYWPAGSPVSELYDSLAAAKQAAAEGGGAGGAGGSERDRGDFVFAPHLSQQEVEDGLSSGALLRGVVHISRRSPHEAVVELGHGPDAALGRLVRVSGRRALNRAMEGDTVAVRLLLPGGPAPDPTANGTLSGGTAHAAAAAVDGDSKGEDADDAVEAAGGGGGTAAGGGGAEPDYGAELLADVESGAAGGEEGALAMLEAAGGDALPAAEVVAILQRFSRDVVACLSQRDEAALRARLEQQGHGASATGGAAGGGGGVLLRRGAELLMALPLDRRLPPVAVMTRQGAGLAGCRFVVRVDSWERGSRYPRGHVVRVLGRLNDLRAESEAVLVQCGIDHKPFCQAALDELPRVASAADWSVSAAERAARRDLTGPEYFVCSIDPVGCTDVDDAMHVRFLDPVTTSSSSSGSAASSSGRGGAAPRGEQLVEVGVHIADVSWFVRAGGFLDGEARDRCTSVYLVDRRLDMLPGLLSEQLCSLRQGVERFAVSVIWTFRRRSREPQPGATGPAALPYEYEVQDVWYGRTIIRSRHQLHYQQAQDVLDGRPPARGDELPPAHVPDLKRSLVVLDELTAQLHAQRVAAGALELASAELRFKVDEATGQPCQVVCKQKIPMMDVVAEMMIAANSAVAQRVATAFPGAALLRNHPPPRQQSFEQVRALIEPHAGGPMDPASNASLAAALERACAAAAAASDPAAAQLIKSLATRAMSEAQYNSSGTTPPATAMSYHYGLALQYYTHFTSPIRRYADVVVHRQLLAALAGGAHPPQPHADLAAAAHNMNMRHRQAKAAQKECSELYLLLLLHARPHVEKALVCGLGPGNRLELFVPAYHLRGAVPLADRRGLPRPPLGALPPAPPRAQGAGQPAQLAPGEEDEDDPFEVARRRGLRLQVSEDEAAISDEAHGGAPVWRARLWQRVWVRLCAAGHRAHGPKLAMQLLHDTHPDAVAAAAAADTSTGTSTGGGGAAGGKGAGGEGGLRGGAAGGRAAAPVPQAPAVVQVAVAGVGAGGVAGGPGAGAAQGAAALPPHLRLIMQRTEEHARLQQDQAEALRQGQGQGQQAGGHAAGPSGAGAAAPGRASGVHGRAGHGAQGTEGRMGPGVGQVGEELVQGVDVLGAPCTALVAQLELPEGAPWGGGDAPAETTREVGSSQQEGGDRGLRDQLRRIARLEVKASACRRGSAQERKLLDQLQELQARVAHLQLQA